VFPVWSKLENQTRKVQAFNLVRVPFTIMFFEENHLRRGVEHNGPFFNLGSHKRLFGELVFNRGPAGIGYLWAAAGVGLLIGGTFAHWLGKRISFGAYKKTIGICYVIHGVSYVVFSQMPYFWLAATFLGVSRAATAVSSVLNVSQLLRHVSDEFRGRVFATMETMSWSMMMLSMMGAGIASQTWGPRAIGVVSGLLSSSTAVFWLWANWTGRLPEPRATGVEPEEVEVHCDPIV